MIQFDKVHLRYDKGPTILKDVGFRVEPGSFHFITGVSGAGKSSLMRLLYLGHRPTAGVISMFGQEVNGLSVDKRAMIRRKIGVIFQDFRLLDHLSVRANVELPLRATGRYNRQQREYVAELLSWVGLGQHVESSPAILSGGQKQRVAIARAIIGRPSLILADEPTGNVDDGMGHRLLELFVELNRLGTTVIVATHSLSLLDKYKFSALHLEKGGVHFVKGDFVSARERPVSKSKVGAPPSMDENIPPARSSSSSVDIVRFDPDGPQPDISMAQTQPMTPKL